MFGSKVKVNEFEDVIRQYESVPVQTGKILFYGHSLFTRCSFVSTVVPKNPLLEEEVRMKDGSQAIVNHGFGTSCADHLLYYYDRMVRRYKPRALVLATMCNDVFNDYSNAEVMEILARIVNWAQADFPDIRIYCFGHFPYPKVFGPSTVRNDRSFNQFLEDFCNRTENCTYVDLRSQPFYYNDPADAGDITKVRADIFDPDQIHLNPEGYKLFMNFIRELLDDLL